MGLVVRLAVNEFQSSASADVFKDDFLGILLNWDIQRELILPASRISWVGPGPHDIFLLVLKHKRKHKHKKMKKMFVRVCF